MLGEIGKAMKQKRFKELANSVQAFNLKETN